jgi:diguanylate cyclase (GGDEF)-like protein
MDLSTTTRPLDRGEPLRLPRVGPAGRTLIQGAVGLLAGLAMVALVFAGLAAPRRASGELDTHVLPALEALHDASANARRAQDQFLVAIATTDPDARAAALGASQNAAALLDAAWGRYVEVALGRADERALQRNYELISNKGQQLAVTLLAVSPEDPAYASTLDDERRNSDEQLSVLSSLQSLVYEPLAAQDARAASAGIERERVAALVAYGVLALVFMGVSVVLVRGARREQHHLRAEATALRIAGEQAAFEGSLQRGLEMAPTEEGALDVVQQALGLIAGDAPAEMLLADSSRAHFRQVLCTGVTAEAACRVGVPHDCPAVTSGQTRVFDDSRKLDTCRFLRGLDEPAWATCVPVSIAGRSTGVLRAQHVLSRPPDEQLARRLELVGRKAGERIGALRVFAKTEAQAQVDPLTGLPNRRTLERQVHEVVGAEVPYVVAFADLDHFKTINDTYGHDSGDRALRLFARVLRDSIRPCDLLARFGGEEFIVVLPDCALDGARSVGERIRSSLADALAHATVPPFTVTIGLAAGEPGDDLSQIIVAADAVMLQAKAMGRDRVVAAGDAPTVTLAG